MKILDLEHTLSPCKSKNDLELKDNLTFIDSLSLDSHISVQMPE